MSFGRVLGIVAGAVGVAALAKWAFGREEKPSPFAPSGWVLVDPHVAALVDDFPVPNEAEVTNLPIGTTVGVILARVSGSVPTTKEALRTTPMLLLEMLISGAYGTAYDLVVQRGFDRNGPAQAIGLAPPPQGQIFTRIPSSFVAKVVARPGEKVPGGDVSSSLVPPQIPQSKPKEGFVQSTNGTAYVGRAGDWIYGVETDAFGNYNVVWAHAALNGRCLFGAGRGGVFSGYKPGEIGSGPTVNGTIKTEGENAIWLVAQKGAIGFKSIVEYSLAMIRIEGQDTSSGAPGIITEELRDAIAELFPTLPRLV